MRTPAWSTLNAYVDGELDATAAAAVAAAAGSDDSATAETIALLFSSRGSATRPRRRRRVTLPDSCPSTGGAGPPCRGRRGGRADGGRRRRGSPCRFVHAHADPAVPICSPPPARSTVSGCASTAPGRRQPNRWFCWPRYRSSDTRRSSPIWGAPSSPSARSPSPTVRRDPFSRSATAAITAAAQPLRVRQPRTAQRDGRGETGAEHAYGWRVDGLGYLLFADGMDPARLALIADKVEEATRAHAPLDGRARERPAPRTGASARAVRLKKLSAPGIIRPLRPFLLRQPPGASSGVLERFPNREA